MEYFDDLYGVRADQETFFTRQVEIIDRVAERVMEVLHVDMHSCHSGSRGGVCWDLDLPPKAEDGEDAKERVFRMDVHLAPNHIVEPDDDYWLEEGYREFAWLLSVASCHRERIEETRRAIAAAKDLDLTLIRSIYSPDLDDTSRDVVTFSLKPELTEK